MPDKKKTKYTLTELLKKCDKSAPMPQELVDWENVSFSDDFDVKNSELIEMVSLKLKEAIYDTEITRKRLKNTLAEIEKRVKRNDDLPTEFIKDILVGLNEIKSGEFSEYHFYEKEK
ncbi:MAG: hypothetical protein V3U87_09075 [Methylococcaceae bacterium]